MPTVWSFTDTINKGQRRKCLTLNRLHLTSACGWSEVIDQWPVLVSAPQDLVRGLWAYPRVWNQHYLVVSSNASGRWPYNFAATHGALWKTDCGSSTSLSKKTLVPGIPISHTPSLAIPHRSYQVIPSVQPPAAVTPNNLMPKHFSIRLRHATCALLFAADASPPIQSLFLWRLPVHMGMSKKG